jgi:hypothetical protein
MVSVWMKNFASRKQKKAKLVTVCFGWLGTHVKAVIGHEVCPAASIISLQKPRPMQTDELISSRALARSAEPTLTRVGITTLPALLIMAAAWTWQPSLVEFEERGSSVPSIASTPA